jgi:hypothetical protein
MPHETTFLVGERRELRRLRDEVMAALERNQEYITALSFALDDLYAEVQELKGWSGAGYEGSV